MIQRLVKMTFQTEQTDTFLANFEQVKDRIRQFEGCSYLKLLRDKNQPNVLFTYSYWENESNLDAYRYSDYFKNVWSKTKILFDDAPQAWSVDKRETLN